MNLRRGLNLKSNFAIGKIGFSLWEKMDSNHRRRAPADLQSAPFGHSGILPKVSLFTTFARCPVFIPVREYLSVETCFP